MIANIYLVPDLQVLREYAVYANQFNLREFEFWEKLEYKVLKCFPESEQELGWLADISFLMGQFEEGEVIYNHVSKLLKDQDLSIDQYVKLYLTFNMLKKGEKDWISKLVKGVSDNLHLADAEQLVGVLEALKEAKSMPN